MFSYERLISSLKEESEASLACASKGSYRHGVRRHFIAYSKELEESMNR
jgi:hypothetical protein